MAPTSLPCQILLKQRTSTFRYWALFQELHTLPVSAVLHICHPLGNTTVCINKTQICATERLYVLRGNFLKFHCLTPYCQSHVWYCKSYSVVHNAKTSLCLTPQDVLHPVGEAAMLRVCHTDHALAISRWTSPTSGNTMKQLLLQVPWEVAEKAWQSGISSLQPSGGGLLWLLPASQQTALVPAV